MGQGFTKCLKRSGYDVTGYDLDAEKIAAASGHGVKSAASPAEVAAACDIVLMCVTSTQCVEDAVFGSGGIVETAGDGTVLVDHSTTNVGDTKSMAARLKAETVMSSSSALGPQRENISQSG